MPKEKYHHKSKITVYSTGNDLSYKTCGLETKLLLSQSGNQTRKNIKKVL